MEKRIHSPWVFCVPIALVFVSALACGVGGSTLGENAPGSPNVGGATYLDDAFVGEIGEVTNGSIHVDPETEISFLLQKNQIEEDQIEKRLVGVRPNGDLTENLNLTGFSDIRVLSLNQEVLVMAEADLSETENFWWFDKQMNYLLRTKETDRRYHGARLSPKRKYVAAKDHEGAKNVDFFDSETGELVSIKSLDLSECPYVEGQWLHEEDIFFLAEFGHPAANSSPDTPSNMVRFHFLRPGTTEATSLCIGDSGEVGLDCDQIFIPDVKADFFGLFTWVSVSPDDRYIALPAKIGEQSVMFVVDRIEGKIEKIDGAKGIAAFTSDSKNLVSFTQNERGEFALLFVDLQTMEEVHEPIPELGEPSFFVSHDSLEIVVSQVGAGPTIVVFDLQARKQIVLPLGPLEATEITTGPQRAPDPKFSAIDITPLLEGFCLGADCYRRRVNAQTPFGLSEFVSRENELWGITAGVLTRFDYSTGRLHEIELSDSPRHINILPRHDRLVIDSPSKDAVLFFDPEREIVDLETSIEW